MGKQRLLFYVILTLMGIGVLSMIARNPGGAIIPVVVLGGVFLLYKFPPQRWKSMLRGLPGKADPGRGGKRTTKRAKFRVIPGSKPNDDDRPKYH